MEYHSEKEAFRKQTEAMGIGRKVKRGDAWYPLRVGRSYFNSMNQLALEVFRTADQEIEHNFEFGKHVAFVSLSANKAPGSLSHNPSLVGKENAEPSSRAFPSPAGEGLGERQPGVGGKTDWVGVRLLSSATVSYVDGDRMVVVLSEKAALAVQGAGEHIGVQLSFDETSYQMMFDALDRAIHARDNRMAYLRDLFHSKQPARRFSFEPIRFPWLNKTQERAVNEVLRAKDVAVVHGPPGTGKTTTLVEAINETLMRESQVLVCAQSNMAVDWISEKLTDRGIPVLRIGNPSRVNDKMLSFTYEHKFADHPDYPQLWSIRKAIRELRRGRKGRDDNFHQKLDRLKSRAAELEIRINADLFGEARVIASTLVGAGHRLLEGQKYGTLFIDEAAQALEAACWIPIRRATRVVFAGDHCQLPPTVKNIAAQKAGLGKTLMERIVENKPDCVTLLQMQYRMREEMMRFSSDYFYEGKVETAPEVKHRSILDFDNPFTFIDTAETEANDDKGLFKEQFAGETYGRVNRGEAFLTLNVLQDYFEKIGRQRILDEQIDVGIISPYRAQVQYLRQIIRKQKYFKPYRHLITVNTVDGFQGQERDVILISMVRSNDEGQIGFLRDLRRMNVAITRARMKLIVLGNAATLTRHPFYKQLYEYIANINQR